MYMFLNRIAHAPEGGWGAEAPSSEADGDSVLGAPGDDAAQAGAGQSGAGEARAGHDPASIAARQAELDAMSPQDRAFAEAADRAAAEARLRQVPEDGNYEFALPDGIQLDEKLAAEAAPILKEAGVSRAGANKLAAFLTSQKQAEARQWADTQDEWVRQAKTDREYGGDRFDAAVGSAQKALARFGTPALREALNFSGMGNHPEMIRLMARVGNAFSDDMPVGSETPAARGKSAEEELYGATTPMKRGK